MTAQDLICLTPFLTLALAPLIIMLTIAVVRNHKVVHGFTLFALAAAFVSIFCISKELPHAIQPLFIIDSFSLFFTAVIITAGFLVTILSYNYFKDLKDEKEEFYIILLVATLGAAIMTSASHFISFFLGLETLSIAVYIMIAYLRNRESSIEASMKYLIIASVSTAFLLFGMALVYLVIGDMSFAAIGNFVNTNSSLPPVLLIGMALIIISIGFKLALVPFHMWTPDVYHGAPVPVTTYVATVSKGAVMALVIRFFSATNAIQSHTIFIIISAIAVLSMVTGNLLALRQQNLKRLLAYSSIAHLGYLIVTMLIGGTEGIQSATFYVVTYIITSIGTFGVITVFSNSQGENDHISNYKGLFWKRPWIALVMTLSLLSLAGIPLTAGFIAKFNIVLYGVHSGLWIPVIALVVNSALGLFYYIRVTTTMFSPAGENTLPKVSFGGYFVLTLITLLIIWLGIMPGWITDLIAKLTVL